ncbi:MAG: type II toxin-antitoxin system YafQ family toxin [Rhodospirillales bacterium]
MAMLCSAARSATWEPTRRLPSRSATAATAREHRCREPIPRGRFYRSRGRLPLGELRQWAPCCARQRVERHSPSERLLRRRDGLARCRGQDVSRRQCRGVRNTLGMAADEPLPRRTFDHALAGDWSDHRDCHIRPAYLPQARCRDPRAGPPRLAQRARVINSRPAYP